MKKLLVVLLTLGLLATLSMSALAAPQVTFGGEGNFGYDFAKDNVAGDEGANFADLALTVKAEVGDNVTLFGKFKNEDFAGKGTKDTFVDEAHATIKLEPVSFKIGWYGWGFGVSKDILNLTSDLKSRTGIEASTTLTDGLVGKLYICTLGDGASEDDKVEQNGKGAFGVRLDYSQDVFGASFIYGQKDSDKDYTSYTVGAYFKPIADLKAFVDYNTSSKTEADVDIDNDFIILGALYTPAELPIELRVEYDLDDEGNGADGFNPWGVRFAYKINPNVKIEANINEKTDGAEEQSIKLNITF